MRSPPGDDVVILVTGTLSIDALEAGQRLAEKGYKVKVLNFTTVKPLDKKLIRNAYKNCRGYRDKIGGYKQRKRKCKEWRGSSCIPDDADSRI